MNAAPSHGLFSSGLVELCVTIGDFIRNTPVLLKRPTITKQFAKNLWPSPSRLPLRKLREVVLTRQLEAHLSKKRIRECVERSNWLDKLCDQWRYDSVSTLATLGRIHQGPSPAGLARIPHRLRDETRRECGLAHTRNTMKELQ